MPRSDETILIDQFFRPLAGKGAFNLDDDAGLISPEAGYDQVVTSDTIACGVHYLPDDPPESVAKKALRVNLSDLAAKGASPGTYVLNLAMGPEVDDTWLGAFAAGLRGDQEQFGLAMLGGDTVSADLTVISVTAIGRVPAGRMVHRFTARPGDYLYVSGVIGASVAGLGLLTDPRSPFQRLSPGDRDFCISRYRIPQPRMALAPILREFASAAMDISDGLAGDADKLAAASGCTGSIDVERIPLAVGLGHSQFRAMTGTLITGGDDYEILASVPPEAADAFETAARDVKIPVMRIGLLAAGRAPVRIVLNGRELSLQERAYLHRNRQT